MRQPIRWRSIIDARDSHRDTVENVCVLSRFQKGRKPFVYRFTDDCIRSQQGLSVRFKHRTRTCSRRQSIVESVLVPDVPLKKQVQDMFVGRSDFFSSLTICSCLSLSSSNVHSLPRLHFFFFSFFCKRNDDQVVERRYKSSSRDENRLIKTVDFSRQIFRDGKESKDFGSDRQKSDTQVGPRDDPLLFSLHDTILHLSLGEGHRPIMTPSW